jgi:hypothetical protein
LAHFCCCHSGVGLKRRRKWNPCSFGTRGVVFCYYLRVRFCGGSAEPCSVSGPVRGSRAREKRAAKSRVRPTWISRVQGCAWRPKFSPHPPRSSVTWPTWLASSLATADFRLRARSDKKAWGRYSGSFRSTPRIDPRGFIATSDPPCRNCPPPRNLLRHVC